MVLRDPFNCMASRLVRYRKVTRDPPPGVRPHEMIPDAAIVDQWCSYAREFLGATNHLSNQVTINFNRWHSQICAALERFVLSRQTFRDLPGTSELLRDQK